jgi:hypothetical protein
MPNQIILTGVRNLITDDTLKPQRDYLIELVAERISEEKMDTFSDSETEQTKYRLKVSEIKSITDIGGTKIEIKQGKSLSQKWRFIVEKEAGEYEAVMNWMLSNSNTIIEMYRESLIK